MDHYAGHVSDQVQDQAVPLQVRSMTKEYKTRSGRPFLAVNDVSLDVPANSITALLGPSGSGGDQSVSRVHSRKR